MIMNQMLDIAGSYIVGGIILLAVVGLTLHFSSVAQNTKLSEISHRTLTDVGEIIDHDVSKLGYRIESGDKIISINENSLIFVSDYDNNSIIDTISYIETELKDQKYLTRKVANSSSSEWKMEIGNLVIESFDSTGTLNYTKEFIKSIAVTVEFEPETESDASETAGKTWKRKFFPRNL